MAADYHIIYNNATVGPMDRVQIGAYNPTPTMMVSYKGGEWRPLYTYPELMELYSGTNAATNVNYAPVASADNTTKTLCGVFALLIGWLGLQYFLVGKTTGGIINILLSLVTCGLWGIINFIQGIMILCMSTPEWERKYLYSTATFPIF